MILWFCLTVSKLYQYFMDKVFLFDGFSLHTKWLHNICLWFWEGMILIWSTRNSRKIMLLTLLFYTAINNTDKQTSRGNFAWQSWELIGNIYRTFLSSLWNWQSRGNIKFHLWVFQTKFTLFFFNHIYIYIYIYLMTAIPRQIRMTQKWRYREKGERYTWQNVNTEDCQ